VFTPVTQFIGLVSERITDPDMDPDTDIVVMATVRTVPE
jgi:hypothetical protein